MDDLVEAAAAWAVGAATAAALIWALAAHSWWWVVPASIGFGFFVAAGAEWVLEHSARTSPEIRALARELKDLRAVSPIFVRDMVRRRLTVGEMVARCDALAARTSALKAEIRRRKYGNGG